MGASLFAAAACAAARPFRYEFVAIRLTFYFLWITIITKLIEKIFKSLYKKFIQEQKEKLSIQRFKGLGEMNPEELWETTLNPEKRTLLQVKYTNNTKAKSKKDQDLIQVLMGDEVAPRKNFIISRALEVSNLDI